MKIPHAPSDATFASLSVGMGAGVVFAVGSYLALVARVLPLPSLSLEGAAQILAVALVVSMVVGVVLALRPAASESKLSVEERLTARKRNLAHLPQHFPNGWYKLCDSNELEIASTRHVHLLGKDVALFRAAGDKDTGAGRGESHVLDAHCPHLGANMGHEGRVRENRLECPFHGWQFEGKTGQCAHIPYAARVPPAAKAGTWTSAESGGSIFLWWDADRAPPGWQPSGTGGEHHGRCRVEGAGSVHELANKVADWWSDRVAIHAPKQHTTKSDATPTLRFELEPSKREWELQPAPGVHTILEGAGARLVLGGRTLASFNVHLEAQGPSLLSLRLVPRSTVLGGILGEVRVEQALVPQCARTASVELSVRGEGPLLGWAARRLLGKLLVRDLARVVREQVLPLYEPARRVPNLGLYEKEGEEELLQPDEPSPEPPAIGAGGDAAGAGPPEHKSVHAPVDEAQAHSPREGKGEAGGLRQRITTTSTVVQASPSPDSSAAVAPIVPPGVLAADGRVKRYESASRFAREFWPRFLSQQGTKKQHQFDW